MLCPKCGKDVGDKLSLCNPCARLKLIEEREKKEKEEREALRKSQSGKQKKVTEIIEEETEPVLDVEVYEEPEPSIMPFILIGLIIILLILLVILLTMIF